MRPAAGSGVRILMPVGSVRRSLAVALLSALVAGGAVTSAAVAGEDPFGPAKKPLPGPSVATGPTALEALAPYLAHEDWLCRALAARELRKRSEEGVVAALTKALVSETDARVEAFLLEALAGRPREDLLVEGGVDLAEVVVGLAAHPHPTIRARAVAIAKSLPPVDLPADPLAIRSWWDRAKEAYAMEREAALSRRRAEREKPPPGRVPMAPGETVTTSSAPAPRYGQIERIHREGLELMICLDETGSMEEVIDVAKASVVRLIRRIRVLAPRFRVGLVTYNDDAFLRVALSEDEEVVEKAFKKVHAVGGGDPPEGVDKAIAMAASQRYAGWYGKATRAIVVVGDAPPHDEDVEPLYRFIDAARRDPIYDLPVRIDTISTDLSGGGDPDGYVPTFRAIAAHGHGTAVRLEHYADLALEIVASTFGPEWRAAIKDLAKDLDLFEKASPAPPRK